MVSAVPFILIKPQIRGMSLNEYLKAQNKTNDAIRTSTFSADELHRFSKSDYRWADNRSKHFRHREVKKGKYTNSNLAKIFNRKCPTNTEVL